MKQTQKELKEDLDKINSEIDFLNDYSNNPDRKKLSVIYDEISVKRQEQRKIKRTITRRYVRANHNNVWIGGARFDYVEINNIKPSVKQGIKRGLGIKFISSAEGDDIVKAVKNLIKEDLEKTNYNDLENDISKKHFEKTNINNELKRKGLELREKKQKIENELNKEQIEKDNKIKKEKEAIVKMVKENLSEYMSNIRKEVEKGLMLDNLNETK